MAEAKTPVVPAAPFRRIIEAEIERGAELEEIHARTGLPPKRIWEIRRNCKESISFQTADRIVCGLRAGLMTWQCDEELREIYEGLDFTAVDITNPIEAPGPKAEAERKLLEVWESHDTPTQAARSLGISYESLVKRIREIKPELLVPAPPTHCRHGHDLSIYGRSSNGWCNACKALAARARHKNKSGKTRRKRVPV